MLLGVLLAAITATAAAAPQVRRVTVASSPGTDLTYSAGDRISVTVQFDQDVEVTGTPRLVIGIGRNARLAPMWMHSGSRLHFGYDVDPTDYDPNGISVGVQALQLNGARIAADDARARTSLGRHTIRHDPAHKVDGPGTRAPRVVSVSISSDPGNDETYAIGDEVGITVEFDEGVTVDGEPTVTIGIGDAERSAGYRRGSGTSRLVFAYEVEAGDAAELGVGIPANGLVGGELRDADGNAPLVRYEAVATDGVHRVDGIAPRVTSVRLSSTPRNGRAYARNETLLIEVGFDDVVDWSEESEAIWVRIGNSLRTARAVGRRSRSMVFGYTVRDADSASLFHAGSDGDLSWDWSGIRDAAGNGADPAFDDAAATFEVQLDGRRTDTAPPRIGMVSIVSRPRVGNSYRLGDRIAVYASFTEPVRLVSARQDANVALAMAIGKRTVDLRGSLDQDGWGVHFTYFVEAADVDPDGVSVRGPLLVRGAAGIEDAVGNDAGRSLGFDAVVDDDYVVDGRLDPYPPRLLYGYTGASRAQGGVLRTGSVLLVALRFEGAVSALGKLEIDIGGQRRTAQYWNRSGSRFGATGTLVRFAYRVAEGDYGTEGFTLPADGWHDAIFRDRDRRTVAVEPFGLPYTRFPVSGEESGIAARITRVSLAPPPSGDAFAAGDVIRAVIEFDDRVTTDRPATLTLGGHRLPCEVDDTGVRLVCERTVGASESAKRITLAHNALRPANAVIDANGNVVDTDLTSHVRGIAPFSVDGTPPRVTRLVYTSKPLAGHTYGAGARIEIVVKFSEAIRVEGTPQLELSIGDGDDAARLAPLTRVAGTTGLQFRYVVAAEDADATGLAIAADAIRLNGGAITDLAGNPAVLSHAALADRRLHRVDGSVLDESGTPVQIWVTGAPAAATGTPSSEATAVLRWEMRSTWSAQPTESYRITSDHPGVRIGRGVGRVARDQPVTTALALPCPRHGAVNARLVISIGEASAPVGWDVLCRYGQVGVGGIEFFQGPLVARFDGGGLPTTFVDTISGRPGVLRFHLDHRSAAVPEVAVSATGVGAQPDLRIDYGGTRSGNTGLESTFVAHLPATAVGSRRGFRIAVDPEDRLDDDASPAAGHYRALQPRLMPEFRLVLIPVEIEGIDADTGHDWLSPAGVERQEGGVRSLYPIGQASVRLGRSLKYTMSADEAAAGQVELLSVFRLVLDHWNRHADPDEYYAGWYSRPGLAAAGIGVWPYGIGAIGGAVSVGEIYHELGHNFGLLHVPGHCDEGPRGGDREFPYADGGTGPNPAWIPAEERFIEPSDGYFDIMACRAPVYISDYSYDRAMAWRDHVRERRNRNPAGARPVVGGAETHAAAPVDLGYSSPLSLAVTGTVDENGAWSVFAAATSTRPPRSDASGEYSVSLYDAAGVELYRQRLGTEAVSHSAVRLWAVRVPIQIREVHAVRVHDSTGDLRLDAPVNLPARGVPQPLH